ncbi:MAG: DnaJ domain-containing protein [Myxococcales bacterium]|nr:DnaJ domain-containing protein [Myxococcales bacterium]
MRPLVDNPYAVLGVSSSATQAEIQSAYKRRARELHPDVNAAPDAEDQFKRLVEAYSILKDERKRARFDAFGGARRPSRSRPPHRESGLGFEDIRTGTDDLRSSFDEVLARARRGSTREGGRVEATVELRDAYTGTTIEITLRGSPPVRLAVPPGAKAGDRLHLVDPPLTVVLRVNLPEGVQVIGRDVRVPLAVSPWEAALGGTIAIPRAASPPEGEDPSGHRERSRVAGARSGPTRKTGALRSAGRPLCHGAHRGSDAPDRARARALRTAGCIEPFRSARTSALRTRASNARRVSLVNFSEL